ncbi:hypothetical protein HYV86_04355 [Candidatus Woesearchaeota archaeon]|nr:hypothetical protein [Candidatus Woesearchaeota archaeon]
MERQLSTKKYLLALILTLIIFGVGILIGMLFENVRLEHSKELILAEKVGLQSLQLQQKYIDQGLADCGVLHQILETNIDQLQKKMGEVAEYEKRSMLKESEFNLALQDYFLTEIQFLLLSQDIDKTCLQENVKVIYFYDDNPYDTQGEILSYLKKIFGNKLLIFSLDSTFKEEPMIKILLQSHNITQFPSVLVEDQKFHGSTSVEVLMQTICTKFETLKSQVPPECKIMEEKKVKITSQ